jgi:cytochrome c
MRSRGNKQKHMCRQAFYCLVAMITMSVTGPVLAPVLAQETTTPAGRGEFLLVTNCARCHAVGRSGTSPHPAAPPFRTLSRRYKIEGLAEALAEGLSTGHPDMPEFVFAPEDVGAIIKYLQSIQQQ